MTPEDLDRILSSEEPLVPSSGFAASVVEQALRAASAPPALPFPWRRYFLGLLVTLTLSAAGGRIAARSHRIDGLAALDAAVRHALAAFADPHLSLPLAGAAAALLGTYLLVLLTLGLTGDPRH